MLILPATAETIAGSSRRPRPRRRSSPTIANVMPCAADAVRAEEHHGKLVILGPAAYAGDAEAGERAVAPFRAIAEPLADMLRPMAVPGDVPARGRGLPPDRRLATMFVDRVDRAAAETILDSSRPRRRDARGAAPCAGRRRARAHGAPPPTPIGTTPIMVNVAASTRVPTSGRQQAWVDDFAADLHQGDRRPT